MWVDATYVKARQDGRVASVAVVIAVGLNGKSAEREVLGLDAGPRARAKAGRFGHRFCALWWPGDSLE